MFVSWAAIALFVAILGVLVFWQMRAQLRYFDAVDARLGTRLSLDHEMERVVRSPVRALLGVPHETAMQMRVMHQRQGDPELEALRQQYLFRRNLWLAWFLLGFIALVIVLGLAGF